jgi:hypothetical protein
MVNPMFRSLYNVIRPMMVVSVLNTDFLLVIIIYIMQYNKYLYCTRYSKQS